jgi:hypothetical protein
MPKPAWDAAEAAKIEVPLEGLFGQVVLFNALEQEVVVVDALAAADDFAVAFRGEHVDAEGEFRAFGIGLEIERLHLGRILSDEDLVVELFGEERFVRTAEVATPFDGAAFAAEDFDGFVVGDAGKGPVMASSFVVSRSRMASSARRWARTRWAMKQTRPSARVLTSSSVA